MYFICLCYVSGFDIGGFCRGITRMGGIAAAIENNIDHQLFRSELDVQDYDKGHQFTSENVMRYKSFPYKATTLCVDN